MLQRGEVACDAHGRRCAGLGGDEHSLVGEEAVTHLAELLEALLQTLAHVLRHPEVKGRGYESGGIAALGQVVAQTVVHEVCHALRRSGLLHVALLPARTLQFFLEVHHAQRIVLVAAHVLGACLHDHARVGPLRATVAGAHAVNDELLLVGSSRNDEAAWTHAERVDAASVHLRHEAILGCRQILAASVARVILYLVNQLRRMLKAHTDGDALRLNLYLRLGEIAVDVACGVARGENDRSAEGLLGTRLQVYSLNAHRLVALEQQSGHLGLEVNLAAAAYDGVAHALDNLRQLVGADMRMGVDEDRRRGSVLAEHVENLLDAAALLRAGVELAVGVSAGAALAEAVVALGVYGLRLGDVGEVYLALSHVLAALKHHGAQAQFDETQRGEESAGALAYHYHLRLLAHVAVFGVYVLGVLRYLVDVDTHGEVDEDGALTRVDATLQHTHGVYGACVDALFVGNVAYYVLLARGYHG